MALKRNKLRTARKKAKHIMASKKGRPFSGLAPYKIFTAGLRYRRPMGISKIIMFHAPYGWTGYAVCPRCNVTMDREYMSFCDRCGQRLDWSRYADAEIVYRN